MMPLSGVLSRDRRYGIFNRSDGLKMSCWYAQYRKLTTFNLEDGSFLLAAILRDYFCVNRRIILTAIWECLVIISRLCTYVSLARL